MTQIDTQETKGGLYPWFLAIRPKTLAAGIIPVLAGSLMTFLPLSLIDYSVLICSVLFSLSIQIATNLFNDAIDFKKKADTPMRLGPMRVTQSGLLTPQQVLAGAFAFIFLAVLFAFPLILKGGTLILMAMIGSMIFSYGYTGGPFPLSYLGLGEIFVVLFYGFVAVLSTFYLQVGLITLDALVVSLQMGLLSTVILAINNLRDIAEDRLTGKRTLAARFGVQFGKWEITILVIIPFLLNLYWIFTDRVLLFLLPTTSLLIGINLIRSVWKHSPSQIYNRFLSEASLLLVLFGLLLILGMRTT